MTPSSQKLNRKNINVDITRGDITSRDITRDSGIISAAESGHESETNTIKNFLEEEGPPKWALIIF